MSDTLQVGARLRAARIAAGYTSTRGFVKKYGIPIATYCQHETGTRGVKDEILASYAKIFHVTVEWLKTGEGAPFKDKKLARKALTEKESRYLVEINKLTGVQTAAGFNEELLMQILEEVLTYHQQKKFKRSIKNVVKDAITLYLDIVSSNETKAMQLKMLKPALNAYKRMADQT